MSHGAKAITKSVTYDCRDNVYNVLAACEMIQAHLCSYGKLW